MVRSSAATATQLELDFETPPRDVLFAERVVFPIYDESSRLQGFIGRAIGDSVNPKYIFTRSFRKSSILYGLNLVRKKLMSSPVASQKNTTLENNIVYLHVVEGPTDVLRLTELALDAVAVFGSDLSDDQAELLIDFARDVVKLGRELIVRVFFDGDEAGIEGTVRALGKLLPRIGRDCPFAIEVVTPSRDESDYRNKDPESWLRESRPGNALSRIDSETVSIGLFLLSRGMRCLPAALADTWQRATTTSNFQQCAASIH